MRLTTENVKALMLECLAEDAEAENTTVVEGLTRDYAFSLAAIERNVPNIKKLLAELPEAFRSDGGGGYSFLKAPFNRHGGQWGGQSDAAELIALGIAARCAKYIFPRDLWEVLPGGVPYIVVEIQDGKYLD